LTFVSLFFISKYNKNTHDINLLKNYHSWY